MNFGLFGLGDEKIGETGEVCEMGCRKWPVHCLTTKLSWLPGSKANRAQAVASAWGGAIDRSALCSDERRLEAVVSGTKLGCHIRAGAVGGGVGAVASGLGSEAFSKRIVLRTQRLLEADSDALPAELRLTRTLAWSIADTDKAQSPAEIWPSWIRPSWTLWALIGVVVLLLFGVICTLAMRRKSQGGPAASAAERAV